MNDFQEKSHVINARIVPEENPFLLDYMTNGRAVLPLAFGLAWLADAVESVYPDYKLFKFEQVIVLKGLIFDGSHKEDYFVEIKEFENTPDHVSVNAAILSETELTKRLHHYSAKMILKATPPNPAFYERMDLSQDAALLDLKPYEDGTLFQGGGFRGVERILNMTSDRLTLKCVISEIKRDYFGQFPDRPFNPIAADVHFQSILIWMRRHDNSEIIPVKCSYGTYYGDIDFKDHFYISMEVVYNKNGKLSLNIISHDDDGRIFFQLIDVQILILAKKRAISTLSDKKIEKRIELFWENFFDRNDWPGIPIVLQLSKYFIESFIFEDGNDFKKLIGKPKLYLANHQVMVESILMFFSISALGESFIHSLAKVEHKKTWVNEFLDFLYFSADIRAPHPIFYFKRDDVSSGITLVESIKRALMESRNHSLLVHIEGTRSLSCSKLVKVLSAGFIELATKLEIPIIPVKFGGGLPLTPLKKRIDFPFRYTRQSYYFGKAISPDTLKPLPIVESKKLVLERMNRLGGGCERDYPNPPNLELEKQVETHMEETGVSEIKSIINMILEEIGGEGLGENLSGPDAIWYAKLQRWLAE